MATIGLPEAIEDHEQGVTHIVRGKDLMDSTRKQTLLYEHLGWDYPETLYWGRVKVHEFGGFSTSSMRSSIETGEREKVGATCVFQQFNPLGEEDSILRPYENFG